MKKTYYKVHSIFMCSAAPAVDYFRTKAEAIKAVKNSDTSVYKGSVRVSDPDEIERIEKEIAEREERTRLYDNLVVRS